jgi:hypothetical protein
MGSEELAALARGLTEAQRQALQALPAYCHERHNIPHFPALRRIGLAQPDWSTSPKSRPWSLTPLGLALKAHIERTTHD